MRKSPALVTLTCLYTTLTLFSGCWSFSKDKYDRSGRYIRDQAYVPVYTIDSTYKKIISLAPQPIVQSGKIYVVGSYLFQVEKFKGVHVINYSDKVNPLKIGFIKSTGATEIAVKNGYLIVNNANDLVTVDIRDITNVKEVGRVTNAFQAYYSERYLYQRPPGKGYYVCPYPPIGYEVTEWKLEKNVENANCYAEF